MKRDKDKTRAEFDVDWGTVWSGGTDVLRSELKRCWICGVLFDTDDTDDEICPDCAQPE